MLKNKHFAPTLRYCRYRPEAIMRHVLDMVDRGEVSLPVAKLCAESITGSQRQTLEDWLLEHGYPTANIPDLAACIRDQYKKMSGIYFRESLEQDLGLTEWEALQVFNLVRP